MNKIFLFLLLTAYCIFPCSAKPFLSGYVYLDTNMNGKMDKNEMGISGLQISNQDTIVLSGKDGRYTIDNTGSFVYLIKPSNYKLSTNKSKWYFQANQTELNFGLMPSETNVNFDALIVGDPQMKGKRVYYYQEDVVTDMMQHDVEFAVILGDMADNDLSIFPEEIELMQQLSYPVYRVFGNHDMDEQATSDQDQAKSFTTAYGPDYYSFNYAKTHFIVLNNVRYEGWNSSNNRRGSYFGGLDNRQLKWLKTDLQSISDSMLIVFLSHIPLTETYSSKESIDQIFSLVQNQQYLLALNGHLHTIENYLFTPETRWQPVTPFRNITVGAACGSWWAGPKDERGLPVATCMDGSPNGYFKFTFTNQQYNYQFIPTNLPIEYQLRVMLTKDTLKQSDLAKSRLTINGFAIPIEAEVMVSFNRSEPISANQFEDFDPLIMQSIQNRRNDDDWQPQPERTKHLWQCSLPTHLKQGMQHLRVQVYYKGKLLAQTYKIFKVE